MQKTDLTPKIFVPEAFISSFLVIIIGLLTLGLQITQYGYYHDDWYFLWAGVTQGTEAIRSLFLLDRPFMGVVYALDYTFLGNHPLAWQIYILFWHILGALVVLWLLRMLWPGQRLATFGAAILFVIYPGFLQLPNASTFQNHLFGYTMALLSIALSVKAFRVQNKLVSIGLMLVSALLAVLYFFIYEYMIGLEGLRVMLLWLIVRREKPGLGMKSWIATAKTVLTRWLVYVPGILGFVYWRLFIFESNRNATDVGLIMGDYRSAPLVMAYRLFVETIKDFLETVIGAWVIPFFRFLSGASYADLRTITILSIVSIILIGLYFYKYRDATATSLEEHHLGREWMGIGALTVLFTLFPLIAAGRDVQFSSQFDRYTLQTTVGVALLIIGFLSYAFKPNLRLIVFFALVIVSVSTHYLNGVTFRTFWDIQREVWWQLSWRAPALEENTVLIAVLPEGYRLAEGYEIWAPANIIYSSDTNAPTIFGQILGSNTIDKLILGAKDSRMERDVVPISRNYKKALILSLPNTTACLHVIDGQKPEFDQDEVAMVRLVASYSKIDQILPDQAVMPPSEIIFGEEPAHSWCYYYQKASLARQLQDWEEVVRLGDEAVNNNLKAYDNSEQIPFLEGYAQTGNFERTQEMIDILLKSAILTQETCDFYEANPAYLNPEAQAYIIQNLCTPK